MFNRIINATVNTGASLAAAVLNPPPTGVEGVINLFGPYRGNNSLAVTDHPVALSAAALGEIGI